MNWLLFVVLPGCATPGATADSAPSTDTAGVDSAVEDTGCDSGALVTWATDADGDGFGDPATRTTGCEPPAGAVADPTDCDDQAATVFPGAPEDCNSVDDDCDGTVDEELPTSSWYADLDGDGYGDATDAVVACGPSDGRVADATDCDDHVGGVHPGATETCDDGLDDDCDGVATGCGLFGAIDLAEADATLVGDLHETGTGSAVAGVGDVDGDGFGDLVLGAPSGSGAAYLVRGPVSGAVDLGTADAFVRGQSEDDRAGSSVAGAGDTNGDGYADLLVGADSSVDPGRAVLFLGPVDGDLTLADADASWTAASTEDRVGAAVAGVGDVNGDGLDDLLLGASGDGTRGRAAGAAWLLYGPFAGPQLTSSGIAILGEAPGDYAGVAVAGAGDVDGDGLDDLLVGAQAVDGTTAHVGAAYLVLGPVSGSMDLSAADARFDGEVEDDLAGGAVAGAGDVDGDGLADVLVGALGNDAGGEYAGAAYLVLAPASGRRGLAAADAKLVGEAPGDRAGASVAGVGDVDGDGTDDVVVGAYGRSSTGSAAGAAYFVRGPLRGTVDLGAADGELSGIDAADRAGASVAALGDADGDGWADVLIGAPYAGDVAQGCGYVVYGGGF